MREPLEIPNEGAYNRPQQPWICGRAAMGEPCAFGPGVHGVCPALAECKPVEEAGEWRCDRPAVRGGPCDDGPTSDGKCCRSQRCSPVRNLRLLRGTMVRSLAVFALGVVLMMLGSSWRNQWLAPGPLTSHHAQVLQGAALDQRCASCHAAANESPAAWLTALVGGDLGPPQSTKCLACHDKTIDPDLALVAHNVPTEVLRAGATDGRTSSVARADNDTNFACSVCHQDHHGAMHAIAAMDNTRCQSCHAQQFGSFASDHPDFGTWPYKRRTQIAFSHVTHSAKHFTQKGREFACGQCHVESESRNVRRTLGYDAACAECHDGDIATSTSGGVALVAMPSLDVEALADAGHNLDRWPERATGDFDGKPPAMMKLLLAKNEKARAAMSVFGEDFEFFDVDPDDPLHLQSVADFASALQKQLLSMSQDRPESLDVLRGLPPALVARTTSRWAATGPGDLDTERNWTPQPGTWFADDATLSVRYQPTGHADPVVKAWYDAAVSESDAKLRDAAIAEMTGPAAPGRCTMCHSIEAAGDSSPWIDTANTSADLEQHLTINWRAHDRSEEPRRFTRFSHAPHLLPTELRDCTACHTMNLDADTASNYQGHHAAAFVREFHSVTKAACATCHNKSAVGESCTQCHNYHVKGW